MKRIRLIATGGTIASEESGHGLTPVLSDKNLIDRVCEISSIATVDSIQLMNLDSTNIMPHHWLLMANEIQKNYNHYDGFVITHGTDTLSYTAAALSYLIQNSPKPIVITGSQKSISLDSVVTRQK